LQSYYLPYYFLTAQGHNHLTKILPLNLTQVHSSHF
jgi:hypothetical protein